MSAKLVKNVIILKLNPQTTPMEEMKCGQVGLIRNYSVGAYNDLMVLRTYNGIVNIDNPSQVWSNGSAIEVELLPKGTEIILLAE